MRMGPHYLRTAQKHPSRLTLDDMSRQHSVLRNTVGYMLNNTDNQTTDGEEKSKPEVIKLGLDLHARQVTECRQLDGSTPQQWDPWKLLDKVEEWVKAGIKVYSCYEAGPWC